MTMQGNTGQPSYYERQRTYTLGYQDGGGYEVQGVLVLGTSGYRHTGSHIHLVHAEYITAVVGAALERAKAGRGTTGGLFLLEQAAQEEAAARGQKRTPRRVYFMSVALCNGNGQWRGTVTTGDQEQPDWTQITCKHCRKQAVYLGLLPSPEQEG